MKFTFYSDPGHGWLKVPASLLDKLRIQQDISGFSYYRGKNAYLEEDCDAPKFLKKMKELGIEVSIIEKHTDRQSKIRSYESGFSAGYILRGLSKQP